MPIYSYQCQVCSHAFDKMLSLSQYKDPQACEKCGGETKKMVTAVNINFSGDGWATKNNRIAGQMRRKNARLKAKENERKRDSPGMTLAPNVGGERVNSWSDAAKLAKSQGKDTSGYQKLAQKEKSKG